MSKQITQSQAMRYNRQILIPGFDLERQEKLLNSHALLIGAGGLGCACGQYLIASGLGSMTILDDDQVELTNLPRQVLHTDEDIGTKKVDSACSSLKKLNPEAKILPVYDRFNEDWLKQCHSQFDIIIDCSDNLEARNLINRFSFERSIPLVSGAAIRMEGQISTFIPKDKKSPCYQCFSSYFGEQNLSCVESGIMSPVVGIVGAMQALEAVKVVTDYGKPLTGSMLIFDAISSEWRRFKIPKKATCSVCSSSA